jgi:DNA-directed RNA polymerase subunit RPC12/RpoP
MIPIFGVLFMLVFVLVFVTILSGFWRMRGMANKVFTLAEKELERKIREGSATKTEATSNPAVCSHCGSRITTTVAQCPNCGAGLAP